MLLQTSTILEFIDPKLKKLECHDDTRAYIGSIFKRYTSAEFDFSQKSIVLLYATAREKQEFSTFQNIGDWLFFSTTLYPSSLTDASKDLYNTIARASYYRCYTLINRQWRLFEELAETYCDLIDQTRSVFEE